MDVYMFKRGQIGGFMRNLNPIQGLIIINFLQTPNKIMFIAPSVFWNPPIFYYLAIPSI